MPKSLTCYICGRGYGTKSLKIHLKTCIKKWDIAQSMKPRSERRPCPNPPRGLMELLSKPKITRRDLQAYNSHAMDEFNTAGLVACPNCARTFSESALSHHIKGCKPGAKVRKVSKKSGSFKGKVVRKKVKRGAPFGGGGGRGGGGNSGEYGNEGMHTSGGGAQYDFESVPGMEAGNGGSVSLVPCGKCGRKFGPDRISKHQNVCKVNAKPRKVKRMHKPITAKDKAKLAPKKSTWRDKHLDFQNAMKYNKKISKVEKAGGDIRSLPPPPKSMNPDLVPCPHCGRKFGQKQAGKHIPRCATTVNRPAPPPGLRKKGRPSGRRVGGGSKVKKSSVGRSNGGYRRKF